MLKKNLIDSFFRFISIIVYCDMDQYKELGDGSIHNAMIINCQHIATPYYSKNTNQRNKLKMKVGYIGPYSSRKIMSQ